MSGLVVDLFARAYVDRFWSRVEKTDGCWLWRGGRMKRPSGALSYGVFCVGKQRILAHRFAWMVEHGTIEAGLEVLHGCDNPPCVRVGAGHLFIGTQAENLADARSKGRMRCVVPPSGVDHRCAKMDPERIREIRRLRVHGHSLETIGLRFGLDASTVHDIVRRRTWRHVT